MSDHRLVPKAVEPLIHTPLEQHSLAHQPAPARREVLPASEQAGSRGRVSLFIQECGTVTALEVQGLCIKGADAGYRIFLHSIPEALREGFSYQNLAPLSGPQLQQHLHSVLRAWYDVPLSCEVFRRPDLPSDGRIFQPSDDREVILCSSQYPKSFRGWAGGEFVTEIQMQETCSDGRIRIESFHPIGQRGEISVELSGMALLSRGLSEPVMSVRIASDPRANRIELFRFIDSCVEAFQDGGVHFVYARLNEIRSAIDLRNLDRERMGFYDPLITCQFPLSRPHERRSVGDLKAGTHLNRNDYPRIYLTGNRDSPIEIRSGTASRASGLRVSTPTSFFSFPFSNDDIRMLADQLTSLNEGVRQNALTDLAGGGYQFYRIADTVRNPILQQIHASLADSGTEGFDGREIVSSSKVSLEEARELLQGRERLHLKNRFAGKNDLRNIIFSLDRGGEGEVQLVTDDGFMMHFQFPGFVESGMTLEAHAEYFSSAMQEFFRSPWSCALELMLVSRSCSWNLDLPCEPWSLRAMAQLNSVNEARTIVFGERAGAGFFSLARNASREGTDISVQLDVKSRYNFELKLSQAGVFGYAIRQAGLFYGRTELDSCRLETVMQVDPAHTRQFMCQFLSEFSPLLLGAADRNETLRKLRKTFQSRPELGL